MINILLNYISNETVFYDAHPPWMDKNIENTFYVKYIVFIVLKSYSQFKVFR